MKFVILLACLSFVGYSASSGFSTIRHAFNFGGSTVVCDQTVKVNFVDFPNNGHTNTVTYQVYKGGVVVDTQTVTWTGSSSPTYTSITPTGNSTYQIKASWNTNGVTGSYDSGVKTVNCGTTTTVTVTTTTTTTATVTTPPVTTTVFSEQPPVTTTVTTPVTTTVTTPASTVTTTTPAPPANTVTVTTPAPPAPPAPPAVTVTAPPVTVTQTTPAPPAPPAKVVTKWKKCPPVHKLPTPKQKCLAGKSNGAHWNGKLQRCEFFGRG